MKHLKKTWVRLFICILLGSLLAEIVHLRFGSDKLSNLIVFSTTVFSFSISTLVIRLTTKRKKLRTKRKENTFQNKEDILDA
jgi:Mn2+/Fe2+ NRAMP family transporter